MEPFKLDIFHVKVDLFWLRTFNGRFFKNLTEDIYTQLGERLYYNLDMVRYPKLYRLYGLELELFLSKSYFWHVSAFTSDLMIV